MTNSTPVIVRRFPERLNSGQAPTFFRQMQDLFDGVQPRIVFDFSEVRELGSPGVHVLLQCLEQAMKRNGDVKLATVSSGPSVALEAMGVDHLFEIFESAEDAVQSFHYLADCQPETIEASVYSNQPTIAGEVAGFAAD